MVKWAGCLLVLILLACNNKKSLSGDGPVKVEDFIAAFPELELPRQFYDTSFAQPGDTDTISHAVFQQFVPDSSMQKMFSKKEKTVIQPVGRIESEAEYYLLANFIGPENKTMVAYVFSKEHAFLGEKKLLNSQGRDGYHHYVSINREPTFIIAREKTTRNNKHQYTRTGYAYNIDGGFMVVMNDSNEDPGKKDTVINPIDTLSKMNKYSGDYVKDNKNFISIRDGRNETSYLFFVYFEKNKGECIGELKGEMVLKSENTAQYTAAGDPCVINFKFSKSQVQVKEEGSCGNHRDIKCFFDDRYNKKKDSKQEKKK